MSRSVVRVEESAEPQGKAAAADTTVEATMKSVPLRHFPSLAVTALANVSNAFEPSDEGRLDPARHPLRAFDPSIDDDPRAGDDTR